MAVFHKPRTLEEACELMATLDAPAVHGGGTALQLRAAQGAPPPGHLVDLAAIESLDAVVETADGLRLGPLVTLRRMERDPLVAAAVPLAARAYAAVAHPRIRNVATVAGNLVFADPRLDPLGALQVLDAHVEATSRTGSRRLTVRRLFTGPERTTLAPDEIVTAVDVPRQPAGAHAFVKYTSLSESDWPCVSVAALAVRAGDATELRLGLGAVADTPRYVDARLPAGTADDEAVDAARRIAEPVLDPIADVRGGVAYKRHLALLAVEEAVRAIWKDDR